MKVVVVTASDTIRGAAAEDGPKTEAKPPRQTPQRICSVVVVVVVAAACSNLFTRKRHLKQKSTRIPVVSF
ncbi:hypothetical protein LWI29_029930 [Acer saccharum]|uniref:Uncharacterized protein n=1 Tax=Acer saccharum TaxID=4024 RepID=A0AA39RZ96_ACESA|nr:hypothetical protein LWI29_029930 [Acer saccharum]